MPVCHECGSEVADNNTFCPFCGISMKPAVPLPPAEDPFANTIAITKTEAAQHIVDSAAAKEVEVPVEEVEQPEPASVVPDTEPSVDLEAAAAAEPETPEPSPEPDAPVEDAAEEVEASPAEVPEESPKESPVEAESVAPVEPAPAASDPIEPPVAEIVEPKAAAFDPADALGRERPDVDTAAESTPVPIPPSWLEDDAIPAPQIMPAAPAEPSEVAEAPPPAAEVIEDKPDDKPYLSSPAIIVEEPARPDQQVASASADEPEPLAEQASTDDQMGATGSVSGSDTGGKRSGLKVLTEGTVLNTRYEILRKIGGGGMGAVYLANDRNLGGVQRAVKEMVQAHIEDAQQEKAIEDFRRESMLLSTLDHPSIPTIYDYFFDSSEGRFYLVMKYISGGDLASRLRAAPEGRIDELTVTEWGFQIADVLSYLHDLPQRIVYRDLKPSNVMLDGMTGKVMLIDFGIARSVNQVDEKGVTAVGTMGYAPPELFSGNVEPRSDIYSLGSTMFHLMTGADPQNNPLLIFDFDKNPRPRQINPRLSDQIERILMRAVEYNADKRFRNAAEMRNALGEHADNLRAGRVTYGVTEAPAAIALNEQTVFCGFCGQRIVAADMFCAFCGAKQPLAQHNVGQQFSARLSGQTTGRTAKLVVDGTTELDAPVYIIEKSENLVGRRDPMSNIFPEVDLSKYDPQTKISRRHARILNDGVHFLVEDLGSSNGTTLVSSTTDSLRLKPHQPHPLASGDRIRLGDTTLHFLVT